jgi:hypothetical protein
MGNTKAIFATGTTVFTAAVTIIACGSDHAAKPDAPGMVVIDAPVDSPVSIDAPVGSGSSYDFSCVGNSAPTPDSSVTITGAVEAVSVNGTTPSLGFLGSAAMTLCKGNCVGPNALGSATTNGSGDWSIGPITTSGTAINGYVRMTHAAYRTVEAYPASPFAKNGVQPMLTFESIIITLGGSMFGCPQTTGNGMVGLLVTDCSGKPINDATNLTVAVQQGSATVGDTPISASGFGSAAAGFYLICDVPPGTTTVSAKYNNMDLLGHDVTTTAGTTTETIIRPGY